MDTLFGDDDDEDAKKRKAREYGGEGDLDEVVYEGDFADDEEKMEDDAEDEEAKELEANFLISACYALLTGIQERLKREYKSANKQREGYVDESDDEEEPGKLTGYGKKMKKMILKHEKNDAYDSDDEKNPYADSVSNDFDFRGKRVAIKRIRTKKKRKRKRHHQLRPNL